MIPIVIVLGVLALILAEVSPELSAILVLLLAVILAIYLLPLWLKVFSFLAIVTYRYWLGILALRFSFKLNSEDRIEICELSRQNLTSEAQKSLLKLERDLNALDFKKVSELTLNGGDDVESFAAIFLHKSGLDTAAGLLVRNSNSDLPLEMRDPKDWILEFETDFVDGSRITTSNNSYVPPYPSKQSQQSICRLPSLQNASDLYKMHRALVLGSGDLDRKSRFETDWTFELKEESKSERKQWDKDGFIYLSAEGKQYHLTWKGAFVSCFRQQWPLKQILQRRTLKRSLALQQQLGWE